MQGLSVFLALAIIILIIVVIAQLRHQAFHAVFVATAWASGLLAILLGATWPTKCKVKTRLKKPCRNWAYGFVFGCRQTSHFWDKFFARIRLDREALNYAQPSGPPTDNDAEPSSQSEPAQQPIKVRIEESACDKCGFWLGVAAALATLVQTIALFAGH